LGPTLRLAFPKYTTSLSNNTISKDFTTFLIELAGNSRGMVNGSEKKGKLE
jgi:hypothetical protein